MRSTISKKVLPMIAVILAIIFASTSAFAVHATSASVPQSNTSLRTQYEVVTLPPNNHDITLEPGRGFLHLAMLSGNTGHGLSGVAFEIYVDDGVTREFNPRLPVISGTLVGSFTTDFEGHIEPIALAPGNYFLVQTGSPANYEPLQTSVFFEIVEDYAVTLTGTATSAEVIAVSDPEGMVLIVKRAQGTNELLSGAIFEIRRQLDGEMMGTISTDHFGEASMLLPPGQYFARETVPPPGFQLDPNRFNFNVAAGNVTTLNRTNRTLYDDEPEPTGPGALILINRAQGTNALLSGATFEVRRTFDNLFMGTLVTDHFGEAMITLEEGDYYIRKMSPSQGFQQDINRHSFTIRPEQVSTVTVHSVAIVRPEPPEPPALPEPPIIPNNGRLLINNRVEATGQFIYGSVFEVNNALTNAIVGRLTTDQFGDASIMLPPGNYHVRQVSVPQGFIENPVRTSVTIQENIVTEISRFNEAGEVTDAGIIIAGSNGRLLLELRATETGQPIRDATFELRNALTDVLEAVVITDIFGEATLPLPPGHYYLRQTATGTGFVMNVQRELFDIQPGLITSLEIENTLTSPANNPTQGRLVVTVMGEDAERLRDITVTVHHRMTDEVIETLTTNRYGEVTLFLPVGNYFFRAGRLPSEYISNYERINFQIHPSEITDLIVVARLAPPPLESPPPVEVEDLYELLPFNHGTIRIVNRVANSGNFVVGGVYGIYRLSDFRLVGQVTVTEDGYAMANVPEGDYFVTELRPAFGFLLDETRIHVSVVAGVEVVIDITKERDMRIEDLDLDAVNNIVIPPTGLLISYPHYIGGTFLVITGIGFLAYALWQTYNLFLKKQAKPVVVQSRRTRRKHR